MGNTTTNIYLDDEDLSSIGQNADNYFLIYKSGVSHPIPEEQVSHVFMTKGEIRCLKLHNGAIFSLDKNDHAKQHESVILPPPSENKKYFEYGVLGTIALTTGTILVKAILA